MGRKKRNTSRQSNRNICFIVEGCTEENYIKLLRLLYKKGAAIKNCNGGSAKKVLEEAKKIIRKHSDDYKGYVIWFDRDTYNESTDRNLLSSLKSNNLVEIYISNPCIENWLLAHFQKTNRNESKCDRCLKDLRKYIPKYDKNDCNLLKRFITLERISVAMSNYSSLKGVPKIVENNQLFKNQK